MVFFVAFLALTTMVLPVVPLSSLGRLAVSFTFALTLVFGALATIHSRIVIYLVIGLTTAAVVVASIADLHPAYGLGTLDAALKLACLLILVSVTLKRTLRPGPVTVYRVIGGIAGYLLIGYSWTFAYQLLLQQIPGAISFQSGMSDARSGQPAHLIYFSYVTLTTVGYGDVHPVHPAARSLAVAEALVGQLYLAILIASLVGMALQTRLVREVAESPEASRGT